MHHSSVFSKMPLYIIGRALWFFITCRALMGVWAATEMCLTGLLMSARGWKLPLSSNCTEISRRSFIFIEHITNKPQHWPKWYKKKSYIYLSKINIGCVVMFLFWKLRPQGPRARNNNRECVPVRCLDLYVSYLMGHKLWLKREKGIPPCAGVSIG